MEELWSVRIGDKEDVSVVGTWVLPGERKVLQCYKTGMIYSLEIGGLAIKDSQAGSGSSPLGTK